MAKVYSVSQINSYIKNIFSADFALSSISIEGEISNCKYHSSGHIYFTLKDKNSMLSAIMFAGNRAGLKFTLKEGMKVIVSGSIEVYEKGGSYQIYAKKIEEAGLGDLYEKFLRLKAELEERGMFDISYKREIPRFATRIGIVTSPTGAAIKDIMTVSKRRNPYVLLYLYPALVQGENAALSIVKGIETLDKLGLDVLIVGRGGGSLEDLWCFNEESVAEAIFNARTPIISAVGHETDFTIADFVADLRAATPSAAAELANFDYEIFEDTLNACKRRIKTALKHKFILTKTRLEKDRLRLEHRSVKKRLNEYRQYNEYLREKFENIIFTKVKDTKQYFQLLLERLRLNSPLEKLSSGYGYISNEKSERVKSVKEIKEGELINITFIDGRIKAEVLDKKADI